MSAAPSARSGSEAVGWDVEPHPAVGRAPKERTGTVTVNDLTVTA